LDLRRNLLHKVEDYTNDWHGATNVTIIEQMRMEAAMGDVYKDIKGPVTTFRNSRTDYFSILYQSGKGNIGDEISQLSKLIAESPEL
jgi:hypothetical protein